MGCHALLQGIVPTQGSNLPLLWVLHCRRILYYWATRKVVILGAQGQALEWDERWQTEQGVLGLNVNRSFTRTKGKLSFPCVREKPSSFLLYVSCLCALFTLTLLPCSQRTLHLWHFWAPVCFSSTTSNSLQHQLDILTFNSLLALPTRGGVRIPVTSPDCHLSFWPTGYRLEGPITSLLGLDYFARADPKTLGNTYIYQFIEGYG